MFDTFGHDFEFRFEAFVTGTHFFQFGDDQIAFVKGFDQIDNADAVRDAPVWSAGFESSPSVDHMLLWEGRRRLRIAYVRKRKSLLFLKKSR